ncbi:hypothetical protein J3R83DRAFT_536 [Lanmaoa asiatica]|nr:hypothetical protein J3R83DRAFT_536 [Lanmaoa asiatica]
MSAELPSDPKAVKKMEKTIAKEAQTDEKDYEHVLKELKRTEKSEVKASRIQQQHAQGLRRNVDNLKVRVDELFKAKQVREEERGQKLAKLHSLPPDPNRTTATVG